MTRELAVVRALVRLPKRQTETDDGTHPRSRTIVAASRLRRSIDPTSSFGSTNSDLSSPISRARAAACQPMKPMTPRSP